MKKIGKKLQLKKKNLSKTAIYLSLGLHKVCPSYRRRLQLSKEAIQHFKTWTFTKKNFYFCGSFLPSWIRIPNPDPDPLARLNTDPIRIRIRNPAFYYLDFPPWTWGRVWARWEQRPDCGERWWTHCTVPSLYSQPTPWYISNRCYHKISMLIGCAGIKDVIFKSSDDFEHYHAKNV